jgi:putative transposase
MDDFEACIAHLRFPVTHRRAIRTTNLLERLFVEERRRLKIIPNAIRRARGTEAERRQLAALKTELDQEYEAQVDLNRKPSKAAAQTKISSSSQT